MATVTSCRLPLIEMRAYTLGVLLLSSHSAKDFAVPSWRMWLPPAFEKLRMRYYALGHGVSVLGGWIQSTALAWLVFRLTGSVSMLGVMGFLLQIPFLLLGPVTGMVVDRVPRLTLLVIIDAAIIALSFVLAALAWFDVRSVWPYLVAAVLQGTFNAFEMPTRQALLAVIVEERALQPSALGVSATLFNAGRLVGPAIAGLLLLYVSEAWCFIANGLCTMVIIWSLYAMRLPKEEVAPQPASGRVGFMDSLSTLGKLPAARYLLPMMACIGLFGVPYVHLMPAIAAEFFQGSSSTFGLMMSASGFGAFAAALFLSMQRNTNLQRKLVTWAPMALGLAFALFALSRTLWLSLPMLVVIGASVMCSANATNVLLQQSVSDAWRGRVVGLYAMSFQGLGPIGTLLSGTVASWVGLSPMLLINALLIFSAAAVLTLKLKARPDVMATIGVEPT